jgi:hypothetical protein
VHVFDRNDRLLGRVRLDTYEYLEGGQPPAAVVAIIKEFQQTGLLLLLHNAGRARSRGH